MTDDLVQRLKTCSKEERSAVAVELARTRMNGAVDELIQMANGVKSYKQSWRTLGFREPVEFYGLEDQLVAIDAIAETRSQKALEYLKYLSHYETSINTTPEQWSDGTTVGENRFYSIRFPNVEKELAGKLNYCYKVSRPVSPEDNKPLGDWDKPLPGPDWDKKALAENKTYQRISSAVQKLEESLKPLLM